MTDNLPATTDTVVSQQWNDGGVLELRRAIAEIDSTASALAEAGDVDSLAVGFAHLKDIIGDLRLVQQAIEQHIVNNAPDKQFLVEQVGSFEVMRKSPSRRWASQDLVSRLVRDAVVDTETGEMASDEQLAAVSRVVAKLTACAPFTASLGWRVTALRDAGIDVDDYCESSPNPGYSLKFLDNR